MPSIAEIVNNYPDSVKAALREQNFPFDNLDNLTQEQANNAFDAAKHQRNQTKARLIQDYPARKINGELVGGGMLNSDGQNRANQLDREIREIDQAQAQAQAHFAAPNPNRVADQNANLAAQPPRQGDGQNPDPAQPPRQGADQNPNPAQEQNRAQNQNPAPANPGKKTLVDQLRADKQRHEDALERIESSKNEFMRLAVPHRSAQNIFLFLLFGGFLASLNSQQKKMLKEYLAMKAKREQEIAEVDKRLEAAKNKNEVPDGSANAHDEPVQPVHLDPVNLDEVIEDVNNANLGFQLGDDVNNPNENLEEGQQLGMEMGDGEGPAPQLVLDNEQINEGLGLGNEQRQENEVNVNEEEDFEQEVPPYDPPPIPQQFEVEDVQLPHPPQVATLVPNNNNAPQPQPRSVVINIGTENQPIQQAFISNNRNFFSQENVAQVQAHNNSGPIRRNLIQIGTAPAEMARNAAPHVLGDKLNRPAPGDQPQNQTTNTPLPQLRR